MLLACSVTRSSRLALALWLIGAGLSTARGVKAASGAVMPELEKAELAAKNATSAEAISRTYQQLAFARSLVGDYDGALQAFRESSGSAAAPQTAAPGESEKVLKGFRAVPALDAIVEAARDRQIVILNEAHHVARHRAFAQMLASRLRAIGFEYLACETFSGPMNDMAARGYPTGRDGAYTREPLFADFVRTSLKLGFVPIAYEIERSSLPRSRDRSDSINERETAQADNLVERVFKQKPGARVFIYVGYSHLKKKEVGFGGPDEKKLLWMAGRLKAATGIDPLTIDQVAMTDPEPGSLHAAILASVFPAEKPGAPAMALQRDDRSGYLVRGPYAGDADMQVFHRPTKTEHGRSDWMSMEGYRQPREIPAELLPTRGRRLIKALVEEEGEAGIAMDQILVQAGEKSPPVLMLPAGKFKFVVED